LSIYTNIGGYSINRRYPKKDISRSFSNWYNIPVLRLLGQLMPEYISIIRYKPFKLLVLATVAAGFFLFFLAICSLMGSLILGFRALANDIAIKMGQSGIQITSLLKTHKLRWNELKNVTVQCVNKGRQNETYLNF
tara:strand:+ start:7124 stop:7531 length:408 start_codon:yes stop_codon:yes gene_type:complete